MDENNQKDRDDILDENADAKPGMEESGDEGEDSTIITMQDEDGRDVDFEVLDAVEYEGGHYLVLLPPEEDGVVILREETDGEDEETSTYMTVTDEAVLKAVFEIFQEHCGDEFDFE